MSVSINEFWNRIAISGIADADECRAMAIGFAQAHQGAPPTDARSLAKHLVQTERLTSYQAKVLLTNDEISRRGSPNDGPPLRFGEFLITQPMPQPPFQDWYWARPAGSRQPVSLLYPLRSPAELDQHWLLSHQAVAANHLQPIELTGGEIESGAAGESAVVSRLPAGESLSERLKKEKRLDESTVRRIGLSVGRALQGLHENGLAHGAVHLERIWIGNDGSVTLLRDATGPPTSPHDNRPGWFRPLEVPALYAAPEFSLPGQVSDSLTDQYALGCLLWHVRTGKPPYPASNTDALIRQHLMETLEPLRRAVRAGAAGDPLLRVIAHAMSKNAKARFRDAASLLVALDSIDAKAAAPAKPEKPLSEKPIQVHAPTRQHAGEKRLRDTQPPGAAAAKKNDAPQQSRELPAGVVTPVTPQKARTAVSNVPASTGKETPAVVGAAVSEPANQLRPPAASQPKPVSRRRKKSKKAPLVIGGLGFVVMVLMVLVLVTRNGTGPANDQRSNRPQVAYQPPPAKTDRSSSSEPATPMTNDSDDYQLVDDSKTLWLPPTASESPALRMIPPGPQMVVTLRLRQILASSAGQQMLAAMDRELGDAWERVGTRSGVPLEQIERLTVALEGAGDGYPAAALGIELATPVPLGKLREGWKAESARTSEGATLFAGEERDGDAYFIAGDDFEDETLVDAFAVGTVDQIKLVAELDGGSIPLPRSLERLWRSANADADMVVLATPNFLFADGRQMLAQYASEAVEPLKNFLLPDVAGLMLTSTLQPQWYLEVRLSPGSGTSAATLVQQLKTSVEQLPQWAEQFLIDSSPDASWKALALRLPQMMIAINKYARFGISEDQAVGNVYLPQIAAPNISLATLLAVNTPAGSAGSAVSDISNEPALTLEQMLERPMSIRFDQEALEVAANAIIDEFASDLPRGSKAPEIFVIGGDLEGEGITQNQQIREFNRRDEKLRTVLTELVMRGNPVTTVESPTEADQKLVWVVGPHPSEPDEQAILVTTRTAAANKYTLPPEFVGE